MTSNKKDPVSVARKLIEFSSVSPDDGPSQAYMTNFLTSLGFRVDDYTMGEGDARTANFFASLGQGHPHLCFAGHSDVVPEGDRRLWSSPPFQAAVRDGRLYGRGACDMKGAVAAFLAALARLHEEGFQPRGRVSLLITGDEEAKGTFGTKKILPLLQEKDLIPDFCIVGEPTSEKKAGDTLKIGRRGSVNVRLRVEGVQGHVAYPHKADNPVHRLVDILSELKAHPLDEGTAYFQPSSLQITSIDVGNQATNVTPQYATARFNIRFNDCHRGEALIRYIEEVGRRYAQPQQINVDYTISGEAFLTKPQSEVGELQKSIAHVTGKKASLDTGGGTSDARFIAPLCPTVELGVVGSTLHKINEYVSLDDLETLTEIYKNFMLEMET